MSSEVVPKPSRAVPSRRSLAARLVLFAALLLAAAGVAGMAAWIWRPWVPQSIAGVEQALTAKRFAVAVEGAERLTGNDPHDTRAWFLLARGRVGMGDLARAIEALRKIPDFSLRKPEALYFEGKSLIEMHRGREAEAAFQACVLRSPPNSTVRLNAELELLALFAMEERWDEFKSMFWQLYPQLSGAETVSVLTMRLRSEFEQTKPEMSIEFLTKFVEADPTDANARGGLAAAVEHGGDLAESVRLYQEASEQAPANLDLQERYLSALLRHGDTETLRSQVGSLTAEALDRPGILKTRAILAQGDGQFEQAADLLGRYLEVRPDDSESVHRLSQVLLRLGRKAEATACTERRNRLNEGRDALRKAWNDFADRYEKDSSDTPPELLEGLATACQQAGLVREGDAWKAAARQLALGPTPAPSGAPIPAAPH